MPNESSFSYNPHRQNDPLRSPEVSALHPLVPSAHHHIPQLQVRPPTCTHGNVPWPNGHQPGVNYAGPYHGGNEANYGDWALYRDNVWNEGPSPPSAVGYHLLPYPACSPCLRHRLCITWGYNTLIKGT